MTPQASRVDLRSEERWGGRGSEVFLAEAGACARVRSLSWGKARGAGRQRNDDRQLEARHEPIATAPAW